MTWCVEWQVALVAACCDAHRCRIAGMLPADASTCAADVWLIVSDALLSMWHMVAHARWKTVQPAWGMGVTVTSQEVGSRKGRHAAATQRAHLTCHCQQNTPTCCVKTSVSLLTAPHDASRIVATYFTSASSATVAAAAAGCSRFLLLLLPLATQGSCCCCCSRGLYRLIQLPQDDRPPPAAA